LSLLTMNESWPRSYPKIEMIAAHTVPGSPGILF